MATFHIPTIDISPCLSSSSSAASQAVISQLRDACRTSGFFQITGHGISPALRDSILSAAKTFFSLPTAEKERYTSVPGRGYEVIGQQILEPGTKPELKEGYFVGRPIDDQGPPYRNFDHPNIWPSASIPDEKFKTPLLEYHAACLNLASKLLLLVGAGLPTPLPATVAEAFSKDPVAAVRLLHYPPVSAEAAKDPLARGAGAHTDFGALTLLLQDGETGGLQVYDSAGAKWVDVPPNKDAYVVNVGDMLERWTGGVYSSTLHRVMSGSKDRYSVPFFFDGNLDFLLKPLAGDDGMAAITVEQHMNNRYKQSYVDKELVKAF